MRPNLDHWLPNPSLLVSHRRESSVTTGELWAAAREVLLSDTRMLGRLVRWRIPGLRRDTAFDELFRNEPFTVLEEGDSALVSGLVGRIWTLRRDYPRLAGGEEFRAWSATGTARVVLANWVEPAGGGGAALCSEARVAAVGAEGRIGLAAIRPLVAASQHLVASDGIDAAVEAAERRRKDS